VRNRDRARHTGRRDQAYLVTEAPQSRSAEIGQRQRRYLVMMGIRVVCFVVAVVAFLNGAGWLAMIPAVGAIVLPYFAVVVGNARRQTGGATGFRPYEPHLPERYVPPDDQERGRPGGANGE
jgi:hypothetical protein